MRRRVDFRLPLQVWKVAVLRKVPPRCLGRYGSVSAGGPPPVAMQRFANGDHEAFAALR